MILYRKIVLQFISCLTNVRRKNHLLCHYIRYSEKNDDKHISRDGNDHGRSGGQSKWSTARKWTVNGHGLMDG
ncbi:hypothetical protein RIR_jg20678.t1 [Rhizophagus irregularis DAOM 181602=DAOM 197198]|nr:hypothetical protein RIR_jg20678.t1 [Rhizophagus irregularis DAOM 181602=DAOM 197198]